MRVKLKNKQKITQGTKKSERKTTRTRNPDTPMHTKERLASN